MSWYPGAERMELQPESDSQPAIIPTQLILHSIAAPWTPQRIYEYWRDSTNLDCHFGIGYDGAIGQFIGTQTRADANMHANRRPDGTGAISAETASNSQHTDPWTDAQIEALIRLGVWVHREHGIPLRICRTWDDPGYGYHRMFPEWSDGGTACPGDARVRQFETVIFPAIVARATGAAPTPATPEADMPLTPDDARLLLRTKLGPEYARGGYEPSLADAVNGGAYATQAAEQALAEIRALAARVDALAKAGGITAAQAEQAGAAGARAVLAQLATALTPKS